MFAFSLYCIIDNGDGGIMDELAKLNAKTFGEQIGFNLRSAWYFEKWYEKAIIIGLGTLGLWKLIGLVYSLLSM